MDSDQRHENRTGLVFAIDNHIVDGQTAAEIELKRLHTDGWIELILTDVTKTEWLEAKPERQQLLVELAVDYAEYFGPLVLGHSRLGSSVLGSEEDGDRLRRVFGIIFPTRIYEEARQQDLRDAMNVATAIRYAVNGFVTRDQVVLGSRDAIRAAFDNFTIFSPEGAVAFANRMVLRWKARAAAAEAGP
jgi:hypothetical protein